MDIEIDIARLGHRGDGVGEGPDGPVFAARALPGERVAGALEGDRIVAPRILKPVSERVSAPCRHFGRCGGCALQHASDAFVAAWKTELLRTALAARGLEAEIRPILTSPERSRRRATFAARRLKSGPVLGFHGRADATLVPVTECAVIRPELFAAAPQLKAVAAALGARRGEMRITATSSEAGLDLAVEGGRALDADGERRLAQLAEQADFARLTVNGDVVALRRAPVQRFGRALVAPPPGGFLQATAEGEAALLAAAREAVSGARRVADLFTGSGAFALPLAEEAAVRAVESEAAALKALDAGWRMAEGLRAVETEHRDLFRRPLSPVELEKIDAVVIDPPRQGARAQMEALAASTVRRVASVSCNPATFARDARILVDGGYRLLWAQPVDQFRWSAHLEIAAAFAR